MRIRTSLAHAWAASLAWHLLMLAAALWLMAHSRPVRTDAVTRDQTTVKLVWLAERGPGGGGGGGGDRSKEPPRTAELPGRDALTVPVARRPALDPAPPHPDAEPLQAIVIPVRSMAS